MTSFIDSLGYKEIALKSDNENAIKALRFQLRERVRADCIEEGAVMGDKPSNGLAENAVGQSEGIIRTLISHYENRIGEDMPISCPLFLGSWRTLDA